MAEERYVPLFERLNPFFERAENLYVRGEAICIGAPMFLLGAIEKMVGPEGEYYDLYEGGKAILRAAITGKEEDGSLIDFSK